MSTILSVTDVTRVATEAVRAEAPGIEVAGVSFSGDGGDYAEVLLRVRGCREQPCQISIGVFRTATEDALRAEIIAKVRRHAEEHREPIDLRPTAPA